MKRILALCLLAAPTLLTASCGISAVHADSAATEERVYTTGSNIGHRPFEAGPGNGVMSVGPDAAEDQLSRRGAMPPKNVGSGG